MPPASWRRALVAGLLLAPALAACGGSGTGSSSAASSGSACDTVSACAVPSGSAPAAAPGQCSNRGSGRRDDLHQQVALHRLPDGLQVGDITPGTGPAVAAGELVTAEYSGWLADGTLFDSSRRAGGQPLQTVLGQHQLIPGFEEALSSMHVGGVRRAVIPPALGYGPQGTGPIPPNATLTFDIEVLCAQQP